MEEKYYRVSLHKLDYVYEGFKRISCTLGELVHILWEGYCSEDISDVVRLECLMQGGYSILVEEVDEESATVVDCWYSTRKGYDLNFVYGNPGYKIENLHERFINKPCNIVVKNKENVIIPLFLSEDNEAYYRFLNRRCDDVEYLFDGEGCILTNFYSSLFHFVLLENGVLRKFPLKKRSFADGSRRLGFLGCGRFYEVCEKDNKVTIKGIGSYSGEYSFSEFADVYTRARNDLGLEDVYGNRWVSVVELINGNKRLPKSVMLLIEIGVKSVYMNAGNGLRDSSTSKDAYIVFQVKPTAINYIVARVVLRLSYTGTPLYYTVNVQLSGWREGITSFFKNNPMGDCGVFFSKAQAMECLEKIKSWVNEKKRIIEALTTESLYVLDKGREYFFEYLVDTEDTLELSLCMKKGLRYQYFKVFINKRTGTFRSDSGVVSGEMLDCLRYAMRCSFVKKALVKPDYSYVVSVWDKGLEIQKVNKSGISCTSLKDAISAIENKQILINPTEVYVVDRYKDEGTIDLSLVYNKNGKLIKTISPSKKD